MQPLFEGQLSHCLRATAFNFGTRYQGKVRDTYATDDGRLVLVTTDRISAFDHVLRQCIPFKGQVLNQLAAFFFRATEDLVPNALLDVPDPNATIARRCDVVPIEFVVRGYLAGHAWREYSAGRRVICGRPMPDGLRQNSAFPEPILTPATKAEEGHDEDISREDILERRLLDEGTFNRLENYALALYHRGQAMAKERGLILVDTKYEFGRTADGTYVLVDEVHTPDSSRYFYADTYDERLAADQPQRQLSKEFVREWLMANGFQGKEGQRLPDLPDAFRIEIAQRYIELYEAMTGHPFEPDTHPNPAERIEANVRAAL